MIQARSTKAEVEQRTTEIHRLLLAGASRHQILQYAATKTAWNLKVRSVDALIARATRNIQQSASVDRALEFGMAVSQIKDLYGQSYRIQDYRSCLACRRELSELLGLYPAKRISLTDPDGNPQQSFIAVFPAAPPDRDAWSKQCRAEQAERELQRRASGSTNSGGA